MDIDREVYFKNYKDGLRKRMQERGISDEAIKLIFGMMRSAYCTEGASLYAINDYLDRLD